MTYWQGTEPARCEISGQRITAVFYDAKLPAAGWAIMGLEAFARLRCETGTGHGQRYEKQEDGRWLKTEG